MAFLAPTTLARVTGNARSDPPLQLLRFLLEGPPKVGKEPEWNKKSTEVGIIAGRRLGNASKWITYFISATKTVAMRRLVDLLREDGAPVGGFVTDEIREREQRVGFMVRDVAGPEAVLAHQDFQTGVQVGRFGVDVPAFERVALPALRHAQDIGGAVIIDELGRMELASTPFVEAVDALFAGFLPVVATVHVYEHPVTDVLKRRADLRRVAVTEGNRDELPAQLFRRLTGLVGRDG